MGFLDGLKKFGLGDLEEEELYDDPKKNTAKKEEVKKEVVPLNEETLLFDKKYTCPICDGTFNSKTVRSGKVRTKGVDVDLRPDYDEIDQIKYDIITCPNCGYSALARYYGNLTKFQCDEIRNKISANYKKQEFSGTTYSYEEAHIRYELAIATAMVKKAKNSEKAYLCLKMAWLLRGETQRLDPEAEGYEAKKKSNDEQEMELLKKALDGFVIARQSETPPIAGMDEMTLDYLMSALALETKDYETALKMVGSIITSRTANSRLKEKAKDLKELINEEVKKVNAT